MLFYHLFWMHIATVIAIITQSVFSGCCHDVTPAEEVYCLQKGKSNLPLAVINNEHKLPLNFHTQVYWNDIQ